MYLKFKYLIREKVRNYYRRRYVKYKLVRESEAAVTNSNYSWDFFCNKNCVFMNSF